ncbi:hypothetical protein C0991_012591 [Blastosporella zonata]|nr:hypothetical protein C0991_012591 [Blastosporella zonata]
MSSHSLPSKKRRKYVNPFVLLEAEEDCQEEEEILGDEEEIPGDEDDGLGQCFPPDLNFWFTKLYSR